MPAASRHRHAKAPYSVHPSLSMLQGWSAALPARTEGKNIGEEDPAVYLANAVTWVESMYAGRREGTRPIHDALIKPASNTRIDLGLALGATRPAGRLPDTGGLAKKNRITHRIPLTAADGRR